MTEIRSTLLRLQKDMDTLRSSSRSIEVQIKELQDRILEVGGVRLRSQKAKVDSISEQMDFVNDRLSKARVGKVAAEKNLEKILKNCEKVQKELEECETQIAELKMEMESKTLVAVEVKKRFDEMNGSQAEAKQQLEDLKNLVDERTEQISKFRTVEQDLRMRNGDKIKEQTHQRKTVQKYQDMLSHLRLNQYEYV
jgi:structural maintenance of chromosome 4